MKPLQITLNKTAYSLKFGIGCLITLGKHWETKTINETTAKLAVLEQVTDDVSFEFIQVITDLVSAAIYSDKNNDLSDFDATDLPDILLSDPQLLTNIFVEFMQSMPQGEGKKIPTSSKKVGTKPKQQLPGTN